MQDEPKMTREEARAIIQRYADECAMLEGSGRYASDADASEVEALLDELFTREVPNA